MGKKEYHQKYRKEYKNKMKLYLFEYLREHPCVDCGESDVCVLEFDHVYGQKKVGLTRAPNHCSFPQMINEITKCEVVCSNCHAKRTSKHQGWYRNIKTLIKTNFILYPFVQ